MLAAGAAVLAGDLAGLAASGRGIPPSFPLAAAAVLCLLAVVLRPGRPRPPPVAALLTLCAAAGGAAGLDAGRAARSACTVDLPTGRPVAAEGRAGHDLSAPPGARSVRLDLRDVTLRAGDRACRIPSLVVRLRPAGPRIRAGDPVRVHGRWWSWGREGWPRPPARPGFLRGRVAGEGDGAPGRAPSLRPDPGLRDRLRTAARRRLARRLPPDVAPAAAALTLADRSGLDPELARRFADAGLAHLLAISGLHVGLVGGGLLWLLGRVTGRRGLRHGTAAGLVAGYVALLGFPPSALRAALLFGGWCAVRVRGAPARASELLGAAAAVGALADPLAPAGPGFQLSFAGFGGVVVGAALADRGVRALDRRGWMPGPRRRARAAASVLAAGSGAFLATAPFAAAHFGRAAPVAVLANLAGVPLTTLSLAGLAGTLFLPGAAGAWAADAAAASLRLLFAAADAFAALPGGQGAVAPPGPTAWTVAALVAAAALMLAAGARPVRAAVPLAAALAVGTAGPALLALRDGDRALVCQLDVGQGDAAAVRSRNGHWIVVDGGPRGRREDAGLRAVVPFLRDRGARSVSLLVLSHPDRDHVGGLPALLRDRPVARWLDAGNPAASPDYAETLDAAAEAGVRWLPARAGDRMRVDGLDVLVLSPPAPAGGRPRWAGPASDRNETSVALRIRVPPSFVYLATGDAGSDRESAIVDRWPADTLRADVMKVGHHGSRGSTSRRWLRTVRPRVAVVSAGAGNRHGHPHPATLARIRDAGVELWRTDRDGTFCAEVRRDGRWRIRGEERWRPAGPDGAGPARVGRRPRRAERGAPAGREDARPAVPYTGARARSGPRARKDPTR